MRPVPALAPLPGAGWDPERQRPVRLLPRPEPIEAHGAGARRSAVPVSAGGAGSIACAAPTGRSGSPRNGGADRCRGTSALRDYYRVEDEAGRRFWLYPLGLYRPDAARWFLHGFFA